MSPWGSKVARADALATQGRWREAAAAYAALMKAGQVAAGLHHNYGIVLMHLGEVERAIELLQEACRRDPQSLDALNNLSGAQLKQGNPLAAEATCRQVLARDPGHPMAWTNLGLALCEQGRVAEGIAAMGQALDLAPEYAIARDNLLLNLNYIATDGKELAEFHRRLCATQQVSAARLRSHALGGRIRLGYVSSDFRSHSVAYFMTAVVEGHDRRAFEVSCYSSTHTPDAVTERFARAADRFVDVATLTDAEAAARIEADGVDILVDLGGHTAGNRLGIFALRPAPIQATYLGYPATTGCPFIDYRLVDSVTDPPGTDRFATEQLVRLPAPFLCYEAWPGAPPPAPLPAQARGHVTYGSFNHASKISDATVDLWCRILAASPESRLCLKARAFSAPDACAAMRRRFEAQGIDGTRINLQGLVGDLQAHLATYGEVDIALDTFPYHGTTTTCEALWMGVPVITLAGELHAARVGASLLAAVGLQSLVAPTPEAYVGLALSLPKEPARLAALRARLRGIVASSALCDRGRLVKGLEAAYQTMAQGQAQG